MEVIEGFEEFSSSEAYRESREGVEVSPDLCGFAGFGIPVFMSHQLYSAHFPCGPAAQAGTAAENQYLLNTLVTLRYLSEGWKAPFGWMDTVVPSPEGTRELSVTALIVPSSMPFVLLSEGTELKEIMDEEGWPDFPEGFGMW